MRFPVRGNHRVPVTVDSGKWLRRNDPILELREYLA